MKPAPKPTKRTSEKSRRKGLERRLEALSKELVSWRDGAKCVVGQIDATRCSALLQWGHFIPQIKSPWLVYAIGNTFVQCSTHNLLHHQKDAVFDEWYGMRFGSDARRALGDEMRAHIGIKPKIWELEELEQKYIEMLENRPALHTFDLLVELGFYGEWPKLHTKG
jgi:hypothetical protein